MSDKQKKFAELFKASGNTITEELDVLFNQILIEDFDDNPERMTEFMDSIQEPLPPSSDESQIAMLQETVLQLSELIMGGM